MLSPTANFWGPRIDLVVKNSRNHFLKLLINSPFDLEILALKHVEKTTEIGGKNLAQKLSSNLVENSPRGPQYIGLQKLTVGDNIAGKSCCRSTARSTATGRISDRW